MMRELLKRSTIFFSGQMVSKIVTTLVYIWMARVLGPAEFGIGTLMYILLNINSFVFDLGLSQWYQKKVTENNRQQLFSTVISVKLFLGIFGGLLCGSYLLYSTSSYSLVALFLFASFFDILTGPSIAYYLELKRPHPPSISQLFRAGGIALFLLVMGKNITLDQTMYGYIAGSIAWLLIWFPMRTLSIANLNKNSSFAILKESIHYGYLQITSFAYARADSIIIQLYLGASPLGLYGAAYRYLEAAAMFPNAIAQNLFHISAKSHISAASFTKLTLTTSLMGLIASIGTWIFTPFLITGLMGQAYTSAIPVLRILCPVIFLFFLNGPLATFIQSSELLKKFLPYGIGNTILNIVANIYVIPIYGIQAAAWTMVASEIIGTLINFYFVKKIYSERSNNF